MAERLPRITAAELLRALEHGGWYRTRQSGSHLILHHSEQPGRVVVPRHGGGKTLKVRTLASILNDAGLTPEELRRLL